MIGMMYLVLTALLALNVSVEILNAFMVVNDGMETTNRTYSSKIDEYYSRFESAFTKDPVKVGPYWEKAKAARKLSDELKTYLITVKYEAVAASERISIDSAKVRPLYKMKSKDKYNETTKYFIAKPEDGSNGKAKEMRDKITKYKTDLLNLLDPADREKVKLGLDLEGPFYNSSRKKLNCQAVEILNTGKMVRLNCEVAQAKFSPVVNPAAGKSFRRPVRHSHPCSGFDHESYTTA